MHRSYFVSGCAGAANAAVEEQMTSRRVGDCSEQAVVVSQDNGSPLPDGIPYYSVIITNTCLACMVGTSTSPAASSPPPSSLNPAASAASPMATALLGTAAPWGQRYRLLRVLQLV